MVSLRWSLPPSPWRVLAWQNIGLVSLRGSVSTSPRRVLDPLLKYKTLFTLDSAFIYIFILFLISKTKNQPGAPLVFASVFRRNLEEMLRSTSGYWRTFRLRCRSLRPLLMATVASGMSFQLEQISRNLKVVVISVKRASVKMSR